MRLRRSSIFTKILVFALLIYGVANLIGMWTRIEYARVEQDDLNARIEAQENANAAKEFTLEHYDDLGVVEDIARTYLGLVRPDDILFQYGN